MTVSIVDLTSGISMVAWLCEAHQAQRRADGWSVKAGKLLTWPCDDCTRDYRAPAAVDFVPTSPDARIPTAAEYPRPAPMAPWPKPAKQRPVRTQEQRHADS
jgi:hypothetical protein